MEDLERLTEALADRYRVESEIDSGGMATVYRARDLKHDRTVAIKVLRPELAEAIGSDRFLREIRTTANLSHPHILALHDSGEASGFLYYVMPFVEGESLRDRLEREGQLPIEDAVQISREVADALAYAHEKGVIHRDVKPANILLERGHALLADFGIAQARAGVEETRITGSGMSLGTPSYMSPEQVSGGKALDGRADQYALGCVLFEMLAGHAPFSGGDIQTVMRQHLAADPPSVTQARASVPKGVAKALHRALAKSPADRFRSMEELEKALAGATLPLLARVPMGRARAVIFAGTFVLALAAAAVVASVWEPFGPSLEDDIVVVLPFENLTGDPAHEFTGRLVANDISQRLDWALVGRVIPYRTTISYWNAGQDEQEATAGFNPVTAVTTELRAGTVVTGSVFLEDDSLRFRPEILTHGGADLLLSLDPIAVAADEGGRTEGFKAVSERVVPAVAQYLDPDWHRPEVAFYPAPSLAAYEAYSRALEGAFLSENLARTRELAKEALEQDPGYLPAKHLLAVTYRNEGNYEAAQALLEELHEVKDRLAPEYRFHVESWWAAVQGDLDAGYRIAKEGAERVPEPFMIYTWGNWAKGQNRPQEAWEAYSRLDPQSPIMANSGLYRRLAANRCTTLHALGKHRKELREALRLRAWKPEEDAFIFRELHARAALGHLDRVEELIEEAERKQGWGPDAPFLASREFRAHGNLEASLAMAEKGLSYVEAWPAEEHDTQRYRMFRYNALQNLERWDEARVMAEAMLQEEPSNPNYLYYLGRIAASGGDRETALRISDELAVMEIPFDYGDSTLWRANISAILGEREQAVALLREAYDKGRDFRFWEIHRDPAYESLRGYPPFEEYIRPKG